MLEAGQLSTIIIYIFFKMDLNDPYRSGKAIEVKGMNNLNLAYIKRFFSHAGPVEEVKRVEDLVVVVICVSFRSLKIRPVLLRL